MVADHRICDMSKEKIKVILFFLFSAIIFNMIKLLPKTKATKTIK